MGWWRGWGGWGGGGMSKFGSPEIFQYCSTYSYQKMAKALWHVSNYNRCIHNGCIVCVCVCVRVCACVCVRACACMRVLYNFIARV
jgi:hypothetical protein